MPSLHASPLFDDFDLTLAPGHRAEALGPLFYEEQKETQQTWAIPPLLSHTLDPATDSEEFDFAYPLFTYDRYGEQYRWQIFQLLNHSGGPTQLETARDRFSLFPFYFQQRSSDPSQNYTAVLPFYGHLKNRFFRDEIFFVLFPVFGETRKKDVVTDNYLYPFFHLRHGEGLSGWQFWPVVGHERKEVTTQTNILDEVEVIGGHDSRFVLWPFYMQRISGLGTTNQVWQQASLPAYDLVRSPARDQTTILWPFFSRIDDREKKYREWELPWPFVVLARGEGKTTTRFFPLFSRAHNPTTQSDFYLWPVYKYNRFQSEPLDRQRTRILFFLYSDLIEKNTQNGTARRRTDFWPLFTHHREYNGQSRWQALALLEPFLPNHKSIERDYSPVWSIWRAESDPKTGAASQSLLWNLYRRDVTPASQKCSLLFGLFHYQSDTTGKRLRLFYIPVARSKAAPPKL
ncbi:MAG: hypothetical protein DME25_03105 [Verrucomicrobia bacterium]|nr:MAG: hypothetical protein DME25_03105 [Verrucomicrobiota bacterium]